MNDSWPNANLDGNCISIGDIVDSEAIAIGRDAIAVKTTGDVSIYRGAVYTRPDYRSEIASIINFYTKYFVGRENEVEYIADFARQEKPGYLLVEALPGYGKSALIAQLVHKHESKCWPSPLVPRLIYFFVRQEGQRNTPVSFLQALNSQLLAALELPGGTPTDINALRSQFSQLWTRALEITDQEKPLLMLVDGLDEAALDQVSITYLLPADLNSYTHVVVTSRPNPQPLQQVARTHPFKKATIQYLRAFEEAEIKALLQEYDVTEEAVTNLALRVLALTEGEPLFAQFVCWQITHVGEASLVQLEQNPPSDVEGYFHQQFRQLATLAEQECTWNILGLLAVALGGMTTEEIAEVLGLNKRQVRGGIEPIMRFLLGEGRLELMHLRLRKIVTSEFSVREQEEYQQRLLMWCQSYEARSWPRRTPDYILAHYAQHLAKAGRKEALYALIGKPWMDAKFEQTLSHSAFAEDVELMVEVAGNEKSSNLVQLVRGCFIYATLGSLAAEVPPEILGALARVGETAKALAFAGMMNRVEKQNQAYRLIGEALVQQGEVEAGKDVLSLALATATAVPDLEERVIALGDLAWAFAQARDIQQVTTVSSQAVTLAIEAARRPDRGLVSVVKALAYVGYEDGAVALARQILAFVEEVSDAGSKASCLGAAAQALFYARDRHQAANLATQALAAARTLDDWLVRSWVLLNVVEALALVGESEKAQAAAGRIQDEWTRREALSGLARSQARMGNFHQALKLLDDIADGLQRIQGLSAIAQAMARAGDNNEAAAVANEALILSRTLVDELARATALGAVAQALTEAGGEDQAIRLANRALTLAERWVIGEVLPGKRAQAGLLSAFACAFAQLGDTSSAIEIATRAWETLKSIGNDRFTALVLRDVTPILVQVGDDKWLARMLTRAMMLAEGMENKEFRIDALSAIARALAQTGDHSQAAKAAGQALVLVGSIADESDRIRALSTLASALAHFDKEQGARIASQALALAESLLDRDFQADALSLVAGSFARLGQEEQATKVADKVSALWGQEADKLPLVEAAAKALAYTGQLERALMVIEGVANEWFRAYLLAEITGSLTWSGKCIDGRITERIIVLANRVAYEWAKALSLSVAAKNLARAGQMGYGRRVFLSALSAAQLAAPTVLIRVLQNGAGILAAVDAGQTLRQVYEAVMEVEGWWMD